VVDHPDVHSDDDDHRNSHGRDQTSNHPGSWEKRPTDQDKDCDTNHHSERVAQFCQQIDDMVGDAEFRMKYRMKRSLEEDREPLDPHCIFEEGAWWILDTVRYRWQAR
ncbi:MAG: hypothetical protein Q9181_007345, partial [Wetmoreana brouardii]